MCSVLKDINAVVPEVRENIDKLHFGAANSFNECWQYLTAGVMIQARARLFKTNDVVT